MTLANNIQASNLNVFSMLKNQVADALRRLFPENTIDIANVVVEYPKDKTHGDFSTNAAMVLVKQLGKNPREIANLLVEELKKLEFVTDASIAGPGFINLRVSANFWAQIASSLHQNFSQFGYSNVGANKKMLVEYVSANPTGPMHIGHSRGAVYGEAVCRLLSAVGFDVVREYYINDAGSQIATLVKSLHLRYLEQFGQDVTLEEGMYPGQYLVEIAAVLKAEVGDKYLNQSFEQYYEPLRVFVIGKVMDMIRADLALIGVKHDSFISEHTEIREKGLIQEAIDELDKSGLLYKGSLEAPKGEVNPDWEAKEQTIFKSSEFGDDTDRAVLKSDGSFTYFAGDFGLALHRVRRGLKDVILILGADHIGYVKRMKAMFSAISQKQGTLEIPIMQMVNLLKNGEPYRMSKRAGNFITVQDVLEEVSADAFKFALLCKSQDTIIDFDFEKVREQSKDNPVFYTNYAHARCNSVMKIADSEYGFKPDYTKLELLNSESEIAILKKLLALPKVVESAALLYEPHRICYYSIELATEFHSYWALGNDDIKMRFIQPDNADISCARLALVEMVKQTLSKALDLVNIKLLESM